MWSLSAMAVALSVMVVIFPLQRAAAQTSPDDILKGLKNQSGDLGTNGTQDTTRPTLQIYQPSVPTTLPSPPSTVELQYAERAGRTGQFLRQFGYDVLGVPNSVALSQSGAVQDGYVLGQGDQLIFTLRGQENATYRQNIDRDGTVILPKLSPIQAAGRTFGDVRKDIEARVAQAYISTNVYVSLGNVRQVSVLVSGEVRAPGSRILSGFASPLDAILLSGGVAKTGSLRSVRLLRGGVTRTIDLYAVLTGGGASSIGLLRDGDKIYVPPIGGTMAITGAVARPGIYELPSGASAVSVQTLVRLAGGTPLGGAYTVSKTSLDRTGNSHLVPAAPNAPVRSGEIVYVNASHNASLDHVSLLGAVMVPGSAPLSSNSTVANLIHSASDLKPDAYTPFAIIVRRDPVTNANTVIPFSLVGSLSGRNAVALRGDDTVYVFTRAEVQALAMVATRDVNAPYIAGQGPQNQTFSNNPQQQGAFNPNDPRSAALATATLAAGSGQQNSYGTPGFNGQQGVPGSQPYGQPGGVAPYGQTQGANPQLQNGQTPYGPQQPYGGQNPANPYGQNPYGQNPNAQNPYDPYGQNPYAQNPYGQGAYGSTGNSGLNDPNAAQLAANAAQAAALQQAQALAERNGNAFSQTIPKPWPPKTDDQRISEIAENLGLPADALLHTASDSLIWVLDDVRLPGPYIVSSGTSLSDIVQAAGGALQNADLSSIEVTSTIYDQAMGLSRTSRTTFSSTEVASISVHPLDVVRIRPVFSDRERGTITIAGQVRYPGVFDITRSERLSSVLERAGGMTDVAYPYGAVFTRRAAAVAEKEGNEREAREVESELTTLSTLASAQAQAASQNASYLLTIVQELRTMPVLGRVMVTADPAVLAAKPELDIILEPGDSLYVPKRPSSVAVSGEVLNPGSFQFRAGLTVQDYLQLAGGTSQSADDGQIFVVLPDGSASPMDSSWLKFGDDHRIPPGSTIVVPRDLRPFDWGQFLKDFTQIVSQIAVAAASLSVVTNHN